jgi:hypothetical protein
MSIIGKLLHFVMERSAGKTNLDELQTKLQAASAGLSRQMENGADTPDNRQRASHVIGIERWSQRRLRTLLGEPLVMDEYDSYRPSSDLNLKALGAEFTAARQQTLALIKELRQANCIADKTVPHNEMGNLSVLGWLVYINSHAAREAQGIK